MLNYTNKELASYIRIYYMNNNGKWHFCKNFTPIDSCILADATQLE